MEHAYPPELARFAQARWDTLTPAPEPGTGLPALSLLEDLLSTVYQASLLREEGRAVTFRLMLCEPSELPADEGPPTGLHRLEFSELRPCTAHELRRLAPAADFHRSIIGVRLDADGAGQIWGIVQTGTRWLRAVQGGRERAAPLPDKLIVAATAPGRIEVCRGSALVAQLDKGWLTGDTLDVFGSRWLPESFAAMRNETLDLHAGARAPAREEWATLDPEVTRKIGQQMTKRVIAAITAAHHGGTLLIVPPEQAEELLRPNPYLTFKYAFTDDEPRRRFRHLILRALNRLAAVGGRDDCGNIISPAGHADDAGGRVVGWEDYERTNDEGLARLDEAIFETAHLIAGLAATDGAVVMTKRFELLGFGAEITADHADVTEVARALDAEGTEREMVTTARVGTRHRSVFRFCANVRDALGVVISQDGGVRFVRWSDDAVTYWNHATSALEF